MYGCSDGGESAPPAMADRDEDMMCGFEVVEKV